MIAAYRHPDSAAGRELMVKLIESLSAGVSRPLVEIAKLGRTLSKRAADVLAYFDRPGTSNGPTEAINGRLEHLRSSALGFRNLTNYIAHDLGRPDPAFKLEAMGNGRAKRELRTLDAAPHCRRWRILWQPVSWKLGQPIKL
jgi:hypothetical protein